MCSAGWLTRQGVGVADTEPHLLPKVVRRAARAEESAAAEGGRGARRALQTGLPLARKRGARVAVNRAVVEAEQAAHHDTTPLRLHAQEVAVVSLRSPTERPAQEGGTAEYPDRISWLD